MHSGSSRRTFLSGALAAPGVLARGQSRSLVVDAHCHAGHGLKLIAPWSTFADVRGVLDHMSEAGIDRTVIFPIENPGYEAANQEIASICERHPGKFIGFARHDGRIESGRMAAMIRHEVEQLGLRGLKIIGDPPPRDALEVTSGLGLPLLWHADSVAVIRKHAEAFPRIPFIIAHLGSYDFQWPEHIEAIKAARELPNIYLDTCTVAFSHILGTAVKEAGAAKVIFGSDGPEFDARVALYRIKLLKLPPADEAKVLGGNILNLLKGEKA